ncbi:MAG: hypothetical protein NZ455_07975 [Bacteroidia bacterium]|nr:hypothetical protein [Bacteroidia bacterium]
MLNKVKQRDIYKQGKTSKYSLREGYGACRQAVRSDSAAPKR